MKNQRTVTTTIEFERLGPSGIKGQLVLAPVWKDKRRSSDKWVIDETKRIFQISARLSKTPLEAEEISGSFTEDDGGSYLHIPESYLSKRVQCSEGAFELKTNKQGQEAIIEFECEADSMQNARAIFMQAILTLLDQQAYISNSPLFVTSLRMLDVDHSVTSLDYTSPYQKVRLDPPVMQVRPELAPIYALYRDAKNSHSDFYRFLCYHKILDGTLVTITRNIRDRARKNNIQLSKMRDLVPDLDDIHKEYKEWIGKPIKKFYDDVMNPQFRHAVAHFTLKDSSVLKLSDPHEIERYSNILYVAESCVREVIKNSETWFFEIEAALTHSSRS